MLVQIQLSKLADLKPEILVRCVQVNRQGQLTWFRQRLGNLNQEPFPNS